MDARSQLGLIQVYTGRGKGKTTAALGLAFRAAGHGLQVKIIQFLKEKQTGEWLSSRYLAGNIRIYQAGQGGLDLVQRAWEEGVDILILDEISHAINYNLIDGGRLMEILNKRPAHVELILTGRNMPADITAAADLVSNIEEIKHPYALGVQARKGIEF